MKTSLFCVCTASTVPATARSGRALLQFACFVVPLATSLILTTGVAFSDTINSVSCSTPGAALVTGTISCSAADYGYANASVASSINLPASAGQAAEIETSGSVSALLGGVRGITSLSTAESSSDISINFSTTGPLRGGYLELTFLQDSWAQPSFGSISELLTIGSYSVSPDGQNLSVFIPIELGTGIGFSFLDSLIANGDAGSGATSGSIASNISLQAFEANETTPVELFDPPNSTVSTPEPESLGMMVIATLVALVLIHRSRSGQS